MVQRIQSKKWFDEAKYIPSEDGQSLTIDLGDDGNGISVNSLPTVSIVTVVRDRDEFIGLMLYNWNHIRYPRNKLEWVIVDDSKTPRLKRFLPESSPEMGRIVYAYFDTPFTSLATKRNHAAEIASGEYIAHYDSDDYYPGDSLMTKIGVLLHYKKDYVFSWPIGVYNIHSGESFAYGSSYVLNRIPEASLAYKKSYWQFNNFDDPENALESESTNFIRDHTKNGILVTFMFNTVTLAHATNAMPQLRSDQANDTNVWCQKAPNIAEALSPELLYVLDTIKEFQSGAVRGSARA